MTDDLRKAAEMALEALEFLVKNELSKKGSVKAHFRLVTIPALRQALAQSEQEQKTPLKVLNLTVFTENRLRNGRVYDVDTLQTMTNKDILAIPDMGKKALKEVLEALDAYAIQTKQEKNT
jgi:DNA-directed RNA polymerase alpha subunit